MTFDYSSKEKIYLVTVLALAIGCSFIFPPRITGKGVESSIDISIRDRTAAEMSDLTYSSMITIYETNNITCEISNTGSTSYNSQLFISIYKLINNTLNLTSIYTDSQMYLYPGAKRGFKIYFAPPDIGNYYIKATAQYGNRRLETWGSFVVVEKYPEPPPSNQTNQTNVPPPAPPPSEPSWSPQGPVWTKNIIINPKIELEYINNITLYRNQSETIYVKATNTGNFAAENVFMYVSSPLDLEADFSPKYPQLLQINESFVFIIRLSPKDNVTGTYQVEFEVTSQYAKAKGIIDVTVREFPPDIADYIRKKIENLEYLNSEIGSEIGSYNSKGYDTSLPQSLLENSNEAVALAKDYLNRADYKHALEQLETAQWNIGQAVFALGNLRLPTIAKAESPWQNLLLLLILAVIIFFIAYMRREKKKNKRPRLLEHVGEE
jgi:hypothetical protein